MYSKANNDTVKQNQQGLLTNKSAIIKCVRACLCMSTSTVSKLDALSEISPAASPIVQSRLPVIFVMGVISVCVCVCVHACVHGLKGVSTSSWSQGDRWAECVTEGGTADVSNPRPAEASAGVMRSGQPLTVQLQRLGESQLRWESTRPRGRKLHVELAKAFGLGENRYRRISS